MTNAHRTITAMLGVIAVLLAINLAVIAPGQEAMAQANLSARPGRAVALQANQFGSVIYRMFGDGTVERNVNVMDPFGDPCASDWCGWEIVPEMPAP